MRSRLASLTAWVDEHDAQLGAAMTAVEAVVVALTLLAVLAVYAAGAVWGVVL